MTSSLSSVENASSADLYIPAPRAAPLAAPREPSVSNSSMRAPPSVASVLRNSGLRNMFAFPARITLEMKSEILHYVDAVTEGKRYSLLYGTQDMGLAVTHEVYACKFRAYAAVCEHTLGTVSEGQHEEAVSSDGSCGRELVHLGIRQLGSYVLVRPGVHDAGTVDTEQHAHPRLGRVGHMQEGVDPRLGVGLGNVGDAVYDTRWFRR